MPKNLLASLSFLTLLTAAAPGQMSSEEFLNRATKLQKKGPLALVSKDMSVLKKEGQSAGQYYRAMLKRQKKQGAKLHSCPPKKGSMNSGELLAHLRKMPKTTRQSTSFRSAFLSLMKKKYPC